jgi:chromate reductase
MMKLGIIVGSLRRESFSRKVAETVAGFLPEGTDAEVIGVDLPLYNQDFDDAPPAAWTEFRAKIKACGAFLFVTPEYNRSIPAALKNALDVASRPYGQNVWGGKKGAVISISPGAMGGFGANHALRQAVVFLDILLLQQPEMYVGNIANAFEGGRLNDKTADFLKSFAARFMRFLGA